MLARATDAEVRRRLRRPADLRTDAGVRRLHSGLIELRIVQSNRPREFAAQTVLESVVHPFDPMYVRSEAGTAGQVERHVHTQTSRIRQRVHQVLERRATGQSEIVTLRQVALRDTIRRDAL